jgi:c-di-GMP-related signal transduction protein
MEKSNLYQKFLELKKEIEKHKWIESEKLGNDIGFEQALVDRMTKHRVGWSESIKQK